MPSTLPTYESACQHQNKQLQLQAARELGLDIPRTLTTNDPAAVRAFAKSCEGGVVTKMLSLLRGLRRRKSFANPVKPEDLADLSGLGLCPVTFQELLPKSLELRVTVVGQRVMSASLDSQVSARAAHDWRRDGLRMLQDWRHYRLPFEVEEKILRLMDYFSLNYAPSTSSSHPTDGMSSLNSTPPANSSGLNTPPASPSPTPSQTFSSDTPPAGSSSRPRVALTVAPRGHILHALKMAWCR